MDDSLITRDMKESYSAVNTLVKALKTTIQLNDVIKTKLLDENNYFTHHQMKIIYENLDLLEDNSLILTQAIQAIKSLLSEIRNLKEFQTNQVISNPFYPENSLSIANEEFKNNNMNFLNPPNFNRYELNSEIFLNNQDNNDQLEENFRSSNYSKKNQDLNNENQNLIDLNFDYNNMNQDDLLKRYCNSEPYMNLTNQKKENNSIELMNKNSNTLENDKDSFNCLERKPLRQILLSNKGKSDEKRDLYELNKKCTNNQKDENNFTVDKNLPNHQYYTGVRIEKHIPIDKIKLSNEIMKNIEITEKHSDFFAHKYSFDNSYRKFLENIIEYRYYKNDLINILNDIMIKKNSNEEFNNLLIPINNHNEKEINKNECEDNFSNNIKATDDNHVKIKNNFPLLNENNNESNDHIRSDYPQKDLMKKYQDIHFKVNRPYYYESVNPDYVEMKTNKNKERNRKNQNNIYLKGIDRRSASKQNRRSYCSVNQDKNNTIDLSIKFENPNFEKLLRNDYYDRNEFRGKNKKPFIRFTKVYGNFFDKDLLKKNCQNSSFEANNVNSSKR